jgi:hypothetical protein
VFEGFPLTGHLFLGAIGTGAWPDSRVVGALSLAYFSSENINLKPLMNHT